MTIKKAIIIIILLALGAGVVMYFYGKRMAVYEVSQTPTAVEQAVQQAKLKAEADAWDTAIKKTQSEDKDFDGLKDVDEAKYGTNPEMFDTDKDGLSDGAEVNLFKTNPMKADTDGDGKKDGREILDNTDPNKK
ncbi:hypothetical protein KKA13_00705 [Patescibacteria group bacterium]|nr:hypothetical protein [Patescibacteria group bacterium]MBU1613504.1 hypothetical protein [Patescibacteria group bacterium]